MAGCGVVCGRSRLLLLSRHRRNRAYAEETKKNTTAPCFEPLQIVRLEDYDGP